MVLYHILKGFGFLRSFLTKSLQIILKKAKFSSIKHMMLLDKIAHIQANGKGQKQFFVAEKFAAGNQANDKCNYRIPKPELSFVFSQINIPPNNHAREKHNKN